MLFKYDEINTLVIPLAFPKNGRSLLLKDLSTKLAIQKNISEVTGPSKVLDMSLNKLFQNLDTLREATFKLQFIKIDPIVQEAVSKESQSQMDTFTKTFPVSKAEFGIKDKAKVEEERKFIKSTTQTEEVEKEVEQDEKFIPKKFSTKLQNANSSKAHKNPSSSNKADESYENVEDLLQ